MKRSVDWPERLAAFVEARRRAPFVWGENDCALFAADWVREATGVDHAEAWRGYATEVEARAIIDTAGGMDRLVPLPARPVLSAQRGDVVLAEQDDGRQTFGVVIGGGMYACPGPRGLVFRPIAEAFAAFEV